MWDLPRPGLEPVSPALAGRFSTTAPPGKPTQLFSYLVWTLAPLSDRWFANIFSHPVGCLFILLMVSLVVRKAFHFMESHFSISAFVACDFGDKVYYVTPLPSVRSKAQQEVTGIPTQLPGLSQDLDYTQALEIPENVGIVTPVPSPQDTDPVPPSVTRGPRGQICGCSCFQMSTSCVSLDARSC